MSSGLAKNNRALLLDATQCDRFKTNVKTMEVSAIPCKNLKKGDLVYMLEKAGNNACQVSQSLHAFEEQVEFSRSTAMDYQAEHGLNETELKTLHPMRAVDQPLYGWRFKLVQTFDRETKRLLAKKGSHIWRHFDDKEWLPSKQSAQTLFGTQRNSTKSGTIPKDSETRAIRNCQSGEECVAIADNGVQGAVAINRESGSADDRDDGAGEPDVLVNGPVGTESNYQDGPNAKFDAVSHPEFPEIVSGHNDSPDIDDHKCDDRASDGRSDGGDLKGHAADSLMPGVASSSPRQSASHPQLTCGSSLDKKQLDEACDRLVGEVFSHVAHVDSRTVSPSLSTRDEIGDDFQTPSEGAQFDADRLTEPVSGQKRKLLRQNSSSPKMSKKMQFLARRNKQLTSISAGSSPILGAGLCTPVDNSAHVTLPGLPCGDRPKVSIEGHIFKGQEAMQILRLEEQNMYWRALIPSEKLRCMKYKRLHPGCIFNLTQDPDFRDVSSTATLMQTVMKSSVVLWDDSSESLLSSTEILNTQGIPSSPFLTPGGQTCSPFQKPRQGRKHSVVCGQAGNSMNVNIVGVVLIYVMCCITRVDQDVRIQGLTTPHDARKKRRNASKNKVMGFSRKFDPAAQSRGHHAGAHVTTLADAFRWPYYVIDVIAATFGVHFLCHIADSIELSDYSTAFSGIDAPGIAHAMLTCALSDVLGYSIHHMRHLAAIEWYSESQLELMNMLRVPETIYGNINNFFIGAMRDKISELQAANCTLNFQNMQKAVCRGRPVDLTSKDIDGNKKTHPSAKIHIAGTPCVAFSDFGAREPDEHSSSVHFMAWIGLRRQIQEPVIVHENVEKFDITMLEQTLGEHYNMQTAVLDAKDFGWPVKRIRRYTVLTHKKKVMMIRMQLGDFTRLFYRTLGADWSMFMTATSEEKADVINWASARRLSGAF